MTYIVRLLNIESRHNETVEPNNEYHSIYDAEGNNWTIWMSGHMYHNGKCNDNDKYKMLLYWSGIVYRQNATDHWHQWNGTEWIISSDPRLTLSSIITSSIKPVPSISKYHINSLVRFQFLFYTSLFFMNNHLTLRNNVSILTSKFVRKNCFHQ